MKTRGRRTFVLPRSSTSGLENQITSCIKYVPRKTYRLPLEPFLTLFPSDKHVLFMFAIYGGTSREKKKFTIVRFDTDFNFSRVARSSREKRIKRKWKQISLIIT